MAVDLCRCHFAAELNVVAVAGMMQSWLIACNLVEACWDAAVAVVRD